jgi:hypothetical protein
MSESSNDIVWLASFDIGKKNFSFYIEEVDLTQLKEIKDIPKVHRYKPCGTPTVKFKRILDATCGTGTRILLENLDLTIGCDKSQYLDPKVFYNMIVALDAREEYWSQCDAFIIEKQMSFGRRHNTMALKIGQHCWSYFAIKHPKKTIVEFPAYHKTQVLGATKVEKVTKTGKKQYKAIGKPARKKWCISRALVIVSERGDTEAITQIQLSKKKDDLCDVICQLQAYKYLHHIKTD